MKELYILAICIGVFIAVIQRIDLKKFIVKNQIYSPFVVSDADYMSGVQFEQWCAKLIVAIGGKNVQLTKGSGDQGVDIIADIDGIKYAIQCKCYSRPLGNKPIQEVNAGMVYYGCQRGVVMTNNYFTSGGKQLAQAVGIELWERDFIVALINELEKENKAVTKKTPRAYMYSESGKIKMEKGLWPHQYAADIDLEYFRSLPDIGHPDFDVIGIPRFPGLDPHDLSLESLIVVETNPFDYQAEAELFARYAERHFKAKTWVEPRDGKYFVVIQAHVYSIQSNYREDGHYQL